MQTPFLRRVWSRLTGRGSSPEGDAAWWRRHIDASADPPPRARAVPPGQTAEVTPASASERRLLIHPERLEHRAAVLDPQAAIDLVRFDPVGQGRVHLPPQELRALVERIGASTR